MKHGLLAFSVLSSLGLLSSPALADITCTQKSSRVTSATHFTLKDMDQPVIHGVLEDEVLGPAETKQFTGQLLASESTEDLGSSVKAYALVDQHGQNAKFVLTSQTNYFGGSCGRGSCRAPTQPITTYSGVLKLVSVDPVATVDFSICYVK